MNAGSLDRRITIQRATSTRDEFNAQSVTWNTLATVWASKEDIRDGERFRAQEVAAEITTRFRIRYSSAVDDLTPLDRIIYRARVYDIAGVKEIGRLEGFEITAAARSDYFAQPVTVLPGLFSDADTFY